MILFQLKPQPSDSSTQVNKTSSNHILFLHIGKAGGGTITEIIKKNNLDSKIDIWHPQGVLNDELFSLYDHILINIRDPVDRAISAINFDCLSQLSKTGESKSCCSEITNVRLKQKCEERALLSDMFKGSPEKIGEALGGRDSQKKKDAEYLMGSFVHSKMSINEHVGGIETLQKLEKKTKIYLVVLGDSFIQQIKYQIGRIMAEYATTKQERIEARHLTLPSNLEAHMHPSHSNYSETSTASAKGFAQYYKDDYAAIRYLGVIGCGKSSACMKDVLYINHRGMTLN